MTYIPNILNTLMSNASNALQNQAKAVYEEFNSGHAGKMTADMFADFFSQSGNAPAQDSTTLPSTDTATDPLQEQLSHFRAFNTAYDETIGITALATYHSTALYRADDGSLAAFSVEFHAMFSATIQQQGYSLGSHYQLTTNMLGELRISGTCHDGQINAFLRDKVDIEQSYARIMSGYSFQQMGRESSLFSSAYTSASMTGRYAVIERVTEAMISANFKSTSLSFDNGMATPLFDSKTADDRMSWLTRMFSQMLS